MFTASAPSLFSRALRRLAWHPTKSVVAVAALRHSLLCGASPGSQILPLAMHNICMSRRGTASALQPSLRTHALICSSTPSFSAHSRHVGLRRQSARCYSPDDPCNPCGGEFRHASCHPSRRSSQRKWSMAKTSSGSAQTPPAYCSASSFLARTLAHHGIRSGGSWPTPMARLNHPKISKTLESSSLSPSAENVHVYVVLRLLLVRTACALCIGRTAGRGVWAK